jgi:hypothetical protein
VRARLASSGAVGMPGPAFGARLRVYLPDGKERIAADKNTFRDTLQNKRAYDNDR